MMNFVLIFRSTRAFSPEEIKQRPIDIANWVKQVIAMGITLDPRNLDKVEANFSAQNGTVVSHEGSNDPTLATMVFFDSTDVEKAVEIARMHPALRYGVTVELRQWSSPRVPLVNQ